MTAPPTVLITGGTGLIGRSAATALASLGWRVAITSRDESRGEAARREIESAARALTHSAASARPGAAVPANHGAAGSEASVLLITGDLSTVEGAHELVRKVRGALPRLDVLVNNAGIATDALEVNADGIESTFMVNHVAPFILTTGLLDLLMERPHARVLNVNTWAHLLGWFDPKSTPYGRNYTPLGSYAASKLANALFTVELARRLAGSAVTVNAFHPGIFDTPVFRASMTNGPLGGVVGAALLAISTPTAQAGDAATRLATDASLRGVTGRFFGRRRRGWFAPDVHSARLRRACWELTEELAR